MMDNLPRSFYGYTEAMHLLLTTTMEAPHLLRYRLTLTFPYLRVIWMQMS